ncbi:(1-_4)-alpha-D-glucan 1-alpha-D-glucosylmutase [Bowdeniella nasicola]|uniref:(1->4)-alpha-D-glucan 1-alpha-D-glucosylmutase n=1 Tax=Bowdeniella nasicola TaxID=208480 RepID=A0A1H3WGG9_9ACTO|nr:malto-oligosyltrehalose synthase [Bowdeniella nasicola]SDZ85911.1 (1->4)-alpha-D-glucan 1-alpha-D-glucosylmutase [Bowdeniella nasicola]
MPASPLHRPLAGRRTPVTTYRLQLTPDFDFAAAQAMLPYLSELGVTDCYLSPILQAAPGSLHGYDVVDHNAISAELGGREAFEAFSRAAHDAGLNVLVDLVPNHMAVPTPAWHNTALWSVLSLGADSPYASWFDVDFGDDGLLMPVLGERIGEAIGSGHLTFDHAQIPGQDGEVPVLRYFDHVFPVRAGTEHLPLTALVDRQHYRLAYWKVADEELNYRRFFDVGTLAAVRVENPEVFDATHALLLELFNAGLIDAFRIDHPDGLADPQGYFERLFEATGGAYIVAEKILEGDEPLPGAWPVAGTTGYDAAWRIGGIQVDAHGQGDMARIMTELTGDLPGTLDEVIEASKREIIDTSLTAEIHRLAQLAADIFHDDIRLRDHTRAAIQSCLTELVVAIDRYRAYVRPGEPGEPWPPMDPEQRSALSAAADRAREHLTSDELQTLDVLLDLLTGAEAGSAGRTHEERRAELAIRFQQVCGAVTAKGVEDTAYYRWTLLASLTEVGADPHTFGFHPDDLYAWAQQIGATHPVSMTLGTTHDTKRGEDVRARMSVISQDVQGWRRLITRHAHLFDGVHGRLTNLMWQVLFGTAIESDPMTADRLSAFAIKAAREQKDVTSWTRVDQEAEAALTQAVTAALADAELQSDLAAYAQQLSAGIRTAILSTKAVQLSLIGVADIYQGSEVLRSSLVDPDNRRSVDFGALAEALAELDAGKNPASLDEEKLWLTATLARLRRARPDVFLSGIVRPLPTTTTLALAFTRGEDADIAVVAERLGTRIAQRGGFRDHVVVLPPGSWRDLLTGEEFDGSNLRLADLLATYPVAILTTTKD